MFADSLGALLAQSIDYAGMFPPCSLGLEPALQNQAEYVRSPEAWMLNTFVLPVDQFDPTRLSIFMQALCRYMRPPGQIYSRHMYSYIVVYINVILPSVRLPRASKFIRFFFRFMKNLELEDFLE